MKALLWQGHRIETDDRVADAAFELARLLAGSSRTERIDVPAEVHGHATTASLVVGAGLGLGMLALPDEPDHPLPGSDEAVAAMRDRIAQLDPDAVAPRPPSRRGFRLPDDFTVLDHDITS
jgi:hypothetical protein